MAFNIKNQQCLAAFKVESNSLPYLFGHNHQSLIINLGGRNLYKLKNETIVKEKKNNQFIFNFWDGITKNISLVSAIVGTNGVGKTTLLFQIGLHPARKTSSHPFSPFIENLYNIEYENSSKYEPKFYNNTLLIHYTPFKTQDEEDRGRYLLPFMRLSKHSSHTNSFLDSNSETIHRIIKFANKHVLNNINLRKVTHVKITNITINNNLEYEFKDLLMKDHRHFEGIDLLLQYIDKYKKNEGSFLDKIIVNILKKTSVLLSYYQVKNRLIFKEKITLDNQLPKQKQLHLILECFIDENNQPIIKSQNILAFIESLPIQENFLFILEHEHIKVSLQNAETIIQKYIALRQTFSQTFGLFANDLYAVNLRFDCNLSSGEQAMYDLFSIFDSLPKYYQTHDAKRSTSLEKYKNYLILLDEADLGFHPQWKKKFVRTVTKGLSQIFPDKTLQIIFTTHDPLTLSDMPRNNIVYLDKDEETGHTKVVPSEGKKSFGANITDLLADSFFIKDGLIGDFAKGKINDTIEWLKDENRNIADKEDHKKIIDMIDEPYLRRTLSEMYSRYLGEDLALELLEKEKAKIEAKINKIKAQNDLPK